jgi:thioredoxin reductase/NAD-dependent dihydropyrimidine dehydrogenase PreA subunit
MNESWLTAAIAAALISAVMIPFVRKFRRAERTARDRFTRLQVSGLHAARTMHPHIDTLACIGCGSCVRACPEGDVLGVIGGKATLIHGAKCVGHGLCADACPVGAITMLMAPPGASATLPVLTPRHESSVPNLFIAGELGGLGLIKNAVTQGRNAVEAIAERGKTRDQGMLDVVIVGAGPAGLSAGLTALARGLRYAVLEQEDVGGALLSYPRRKIVLTSPVELAVWGRLRFTEVSKEKLLEVWKEIVESTGLQVATRERMLDVTPRDGAFTVHSTGGQYVARHVVLALGRRGIPRKLGVQGEQLPKVAYQLMDAESYREMHVLVVGGGDSAVEAAVALAHQGSNRVTLSYRQHELSRIKERNAQHLRDLARRGSIRVMLGSRVDTIEPDAVTLATSEGRLALRNDYVIICAGGEMPFTQLERMGVRFHRASS